MPLGSRSEQTNDERIYCERRKYSYRVQGTRPSSSLRESEKREEEERERGRE